MFEKFRAQGEGLVGTKSVYMRAGQGGGRGYLCLRGIRGRCPEVGTKDTGLKSQPNIQ